MTIRSQVKIRHNSFAGFPLNPLTKYKLIVLYLFMTTPIIDSSPKYGYIYLTRPYLFVKITKCMVRLNINEKVNENVGKINNNHILPNNQIFEIISWSVNFGNGRIFTYLLKPFLFPKNLLT